MLGFNSIGDYFKFAGKVFLANILIGILLSLIITIIALITASSLELSASFVSKKESFVNKETRKICSNANKAFAIDTSYDTFKRISGQDPVMYRHLLDLYNRGKLQPENIKMY
jgi:hypothetical protein